MAQQVKNLTSIHEDVGLIPGLPRWVKRSCIAVAVAKAGSGSSDSTLCLGTSCASGAALKGKNKINKK